VSTLLGVQTEQGREQQTGDTRRQKRKHLLPNAPNEAPRPSFRCSQKVRSGTQRGMKAGRPVWMVKRAAITEN